MKKVLFFSINDHVSWGGSEELWSQTALALSNVIDVSIYVKKWTTTPKRIIELQNAGAKIIFKNTTNKKQSESLLNRIYKKLKPRINSKRDINIDMYDLIVFSLGNHLDKNFLSVYDRFDIGSKKFIIVNQLVTDLRNINDTYLNRFRKSYTDAHTVFLLSEENKTKLELQLAIRLTNTDFINNPFNINQKYLEPHENSLNSIACVAAYTSFHKGQDLLLNVLSKDKWKSRNILLNLYGQGQNQEQLTRLIELYDLEDKVFIKGHEDDKEKIWKNNILCIMPSRMEGQSLAFLEAMSYGRGVISTRVGDANRLIQHGLNGYLIPSPTTDQIDITLEEAWTNRKDWKKIGLNAKSSLKEIMIEDPVDFFKNKILSII